MRYILNDWYSLCGYKLLPFGLYDRIRGAFTFFPKWKYEIILDCDGQTDIDTDKLNDEQRNFIRGLLRDKAIRECKSDEHLKEHQKYVKYDNVHKNLVHWSITGKCNFRCKHCLMSCPDDTLPEMSFEQCKDAIRQMKECGIRKITLTGGEPLAHPHFLDIVQEIIDNGIEIDGILTNGALVTRELLEALKSKNVNCLFQMSFDGVGWHDWLRGVPGAEEKVINAFKLCREYGFHTSTGMCLHRNNLGTIRESVNLLADLGVGGAKITNTDVSGEWVDHPEYFITEEEVYEAILKYIPEYIEDGARMGISLNGAFEYEPGMPTAHVACCNSGTGGNYNRPLCKSISDGFYLSPEGVVMPCQPFVDKEIGKKYESIFDRSLKEILTDSPYLDDTSCKLEDWLDNNEKCKTCEYIWICHSGCRARAIERNELDYLHNDDVQCKFFLDGWYDKFDKIVKDTVPAFEKLSGVKLDEWETE